MEKSEKKPSLKVLLEQNPNRVPVVVEKYSKCKLQGNEKPIKLLVPRSQLFCRVIPIMRSKIQGLSEKKALIFFANNTVPTMTCTMGELYEQHKGEDGKLHLVYTLENVFG